MQRSIKVSKRVTQKQTSIWTRPAAEEFFGISFLSREHQIALSADIEAIFLQIAVPSDDSRSILFFWPEDSKQNMEVYEYKQHVSEAKSLPNCANYSFHKVANDNAVNDQSIVRSVQRIIYMDDCVKSVRSPQEAI